MEEARINITSEIKNIRKASSRILDSLFQYELDEEVLFDIRLSAEEAIRNAIVHGNRNNKKLHVKIHYRVENDSLNIEVEDEGLGFKPEELPDPKVSGNRLKESGRGICLIKRLMNRVEFNKKGNKIFMEKSLK
ncbi:MAG: ATP-binding protein [Candidatus Omnitrophota bacterium]|nr:ATP-binding protein [Candidatus Omnitrophota bacterium]